MNSLFEKRALQCAVALGGCVPVFAGGFGAARGLDLFAGVAAGAGVDSHFRYLSGLLLAIGIGFWSCIPRIEQHSQRFALLTFIVVIGGFARALGVAATGAHGAGTMAALTMELIVTPALMLWQRRVVSGQALTRAA